MNASAKAILEIVRALCVLGLVFLNFGAAPAVSAQVEAAGLSFCGDADDQPAHAHETPCHACRAAGIEPAPPRAPAVPAFAMAPVVFGTASASVLRRAAPGAFAARAPPAA